MRTNQTFSISFFIRKKKNQPETGHLYSRITCDGKSLEISLKRSLPVSNWNQKAEKMAGHGYESFSINKKIDETRHLLFDAYDSLLKQGKIITTHLIKARFLGTDQDHKSLQDLLDYHEIKMKKVLKPGTLKNYTTTNTYLKDYLLKKHRTTDLYLKHIDYQFILGFESYLSVQDGLNNNGLMKHMERFKKLMKLAEDLDWIEKNPAKRFKLRFLPVDTVYLSKSELEKLKNSSIENPTLRLNRDIFVFACYTGLAYADVKALTPDNIQLGNNGRKWIYTRRSKTNTTVRIPLLEVPEKIISKYNEHPKIEGKNLLLPVYSNQKTNQYLKEIAGKLEIRKKLSFHIARHTFATTITLANGVPIETVSKLLGHTKITTTQIYARVLDSKLGKDMDDLEQKLR